MLIYCCCCCFGFGFAAKQLQCAVKYFYYSKSNYRAKAVAGAGAIAEFRFCDRHSRENFKRFDLVGSSWPSMFLVAFTFGYCFPFINTTNAMKCIRLQFRIVFLFVPQCLPNFAGRFLTNQLICQEKFALFSFPMFGCDFLVGEVISFDSFETWTCAEKNVENLNDLLFIFIMRRLC